ncbi:NYN domain-containing protein [Cellulomonas bogoriensis]|uniref:Nuclease n=1 Tax=Cellulomonas bogoriensis 69B4 = DSM 16987 TaxID=1386082 RepID=A0A0A0C0X0_9CELL|nr:NYN domain-containing protein [Cellulomonas bogoriensis]KGM13810.1 nuclease [Cellulomonas bogoriensis 69B4 = DSM 16987]
MTTTHEGTTADPTGRTTYVLVDGENIDATLGGSILNARPAPEERPRWERVLSFAREQWGGAEVKGLFFLNASHGTMPMSFVQALTAIGFRPIPLAGSSHEKVVDIGIQRTIEALLDRPGDVLLASHDGDFAPYVAQLLGPDRRVGLLGFEELISGSLQQLVDGGLEIFDLEHHVHAFNVELPRLRIIPLEEFDPLRYL